MSESKRGKGASTAAFLFLPQFKMSLEGLKEVLPIFIRTLAMMFSQGGLIARNHPATRYGMEGVKRTGFAALMGEGWYTLRTTRATPYQWGLYFSIVLMIALMVCSVGGAALSLITNVSTVAQAQIFAHPGNPYGGSANQTDMTTMENAINSASSPLPANPIFDTRYNKGEVYDPNNPAAVDFALQVLDKVIRQGAGGVGGSSQNALQPLMQIYNSGVLVIAAVILFWMIVSIVVDTAKTGQIGGGRHNMVWAPIRIVFALGLMIPLGATGFSSGQFMVMKIAEWGSNFGSSAWAKYIGGVTSISSIMPGYNPKNVSELAAGIAKIKVCQVANNTFANSANNTPSPSELVSISRDKSITGGILTNTYTDGSNGIKCGTIWLSEGTALNDIGTLAGQVISNANPITQVLGAPQVRNMTTTFRFAMQTAMNNTIDETRTSSKPVYFPATQLACTFVAARWSQGGPNNTNPVLNGSIATGQLCLDGGDTTGNAVSQGNTANDKYGFGAGLTQVNVDPTATGYAPACTPAGSKTTPGVACNEAIANAIIDNLNATFCGTSSSCGGTAYSSTNATASGVLIQAMQSSWTALLGDLQARGWAGMGMWYQTVAMMAKLSGSVEKLDVGFTPGTLWSYSTNGEADSYDTGKMANNVTSMLVSYDGWWEAATSTAGASQPTSLTGRNREIKTSSEAGTLGKLFSDRDDEWFMFDILQGENDDVYPMAGLAAAGDNIMTWGLGVLAAGAVVEAGVKVAKVTAAAQTLGASAQATGLSGDNAFSKMSSTIGMVLVIAGIMISYYLPILPFIRLAFAVVTWVISVFEAVVMVPVAALAHLTSEGDGLAGGARQAWVLWLNILMRPVLVVFGFVGAMLVFNTFITYFQPAFATIAITMSTASSVIGTAVSKVVYTIIFVATVYTGANVVFKMIDALPNALMRWFGGASPDNSYDHDGGAEGMLIAGSNLFRGGIGGNGMSAAEGKAYGDTINQGQQARAAATTPAGQNPAPYRGGGIGFRSDRRLKEDIVPMGQENGHNIYAFKYIGEPGTYIGVMADEVMKTHPEAVEMADNGYYAVFYDRIGVNFREI